MGEDMIVQELPDLSEISSEHPFHLCRGIFLMFLSEILH
jgi:hypothetical protein